MANGLNKSMKEILTDLLGDGTNPPSRLSGIGSERKMVAAQALRDLGVIKITLTHGLYFASLANIKVPPQR